jgi:hypothetical protein
MPATETIDLYREVHKGLSNALLTLTKAAGALSTDRRTDGEFAELFRQVDMMLTTHPRSRPVTC